MESYNLKTIDDLSYKVSGSTDINTIDRDAFPIIINNTKKLEKLGIFKEVIESQDVIFEDRSLSIIVSNPFYEKVKFVIASYLESETPPTFSELLTLKIPDDKAMECINVRSDMLINLISQISASDKSFIENIINTVLQGNNFNAQSLKEINTLNKILYFNNLSFIKMMMPNFKDLILDY